MDKSKSTRVRKRKASPEETIYRNFIEQPPQLTDEESRLIEERYFADRVTLRLALKSLTHPAAYLVDGATKDDKGAKRFAQLSVWVAEYSTRLKSLAELMDTAGVRVKLALCSRADMQALMEMAKSGVEVRQ